MKKIFILLCFVSSIAVAQTKSFPTLEDVNNASKSWSQMFLKAEYVQMFDNMKAYWPVPLEKIEGMKTKTIEFKDIIRQNYGNPIDIVRISGQNLGGVAYREVYFLRHKVSTLRAIFTYYNNGTGWLLSSFEWDDSYSKEFVNEE